MSRCVQNVYWYCIYNLQLRKIDLASTDCPLKVCKFEHVSTRPMDLFFQHELGPHYAAVARPHFSPAVHWFQKQ